MNKIDIKIGVTIIKKKKQGKKKKKQPEKENRIKNKKRRIKLRKIRKNFETIKKNNIGKLKKKKNRDYVKTRSMLEILCYFGVYSFHTDCNVDALIELLSAIFYRLQRMGIFI